MAKVKKPAKTKANGKHTADKKPKGCYVLSLTVENIRCFGPETTLDCSDGEGRPRQWTILLGDNGTGKTTLLQSICSHENYAANSDPIYGDPKILKRYSTFYRRTKAAHPAKCTMSISRGESLTERNGKIQENVWNIYTGYTAGYSAQCHELKFYGYGPNRLGATLQRLQTNTRMDDDATTTIMVASSQLPDPESWLLSLDYSRTKNNPHQERLFNKTIDLLLGVLPGVNGITMNPGKGICPEPFVEFNTIYGRVPIRQLGHGYQAMIAWITDFVRRLVERYPGSEDPLYEPAVCLIDEIDLHLHPVWQRKLISYLSERFPNTQFIVTAHSPLVVQAAANADANIAVLVQSKEKDSDGNHYVEIRNNPEDVKNWRLDQIYTSDLFGGISLNPPEVEELLRRRNTSSISSE